MKFETEQEDFWAGDFGKDYIERNDCEKLLNSKTFMWQRILRSTTSIKNIMELGCNIGLNLIALKKLNPNFKLSGYEINERAFLRAKETNVGKIYNTSILDKIKEEPADLTFTCTVLIHINPNHLKKVYENLVNKTKRYVIVAEYYNPTPVKINYRGHKNKLFKRDFAGDLINDYNLKLIDYGFIYNKDELAPQDDINWFLLEK